MKLTWALTIHNTILCLGSLAMFLGLCEAVFTIIVEDGFFGAYCDPNRQYSQGRLGFWLYVFYLSKYYELLDTIFQVLKNHDLQLLHVLHHCLTLSIAWTGMATYTTYQWIAAVQNTAIHTAMYYYYLGRVWGRDVWWKV